MFIAALFTITRTWTQPRCLLADEWIRKLWCMYAKVMKLFQTKQRNRPTGHDQEGRRGLNEVVPGTSVGKAIPGHPVLDSSFQVVAMI